MNIEQGKSAQPEITKRPVLVVLIGCLFIAAGAFGIIYHAPEFRILDSELMWVLSVRLLAIVGGVFALRGANWARWLLLAWIVYHVILSVFHPISELVVHVVLCVVVAYGLFRSQSSVYFREAR